MSNSPLFQIVHISKKINNKTILHDINLTINEGEFFSIVGPSGSGKTTLLRLLNGLESFENGHIIYKNKSILNGDFQSLRKKVGMVFQNPVVFGKSVTENLNIRKQWDKSFSLTEIDLINILEKVGLSKDQLTMDARSLSGGEKQRLSLARTMLNNPNVLLLDEPTANLDPRLGEQILHTINQLRHEMNVTIIMVSHNIFQAKKFSSNAAFLIGGTIVESGDYSILENPKTEAAQHFLTEKD